MVAKDIIIEAEQFKTGLQKPKGTGEFNEIVLNPNICDQIDDQFFHITCHIDQTLRTKIEKGEFVDLERLLPSDKISGKLAEEGKLEIVNKNGMTYFVPAGE